MINRTEGKAEDRKTRPADEKELRRWLAGAETAGAVLEEAAMITMVEDREGDIYDQFARRPDNVHLLVRAAQNRTLADNERLFERCAAWSAVTHHRSWCPRSAAPRRAPSGPPCRGALRRGHGEAAWSRRQGPAGELSLRVVDVREVDPPADPDQRVHWCLLTTHAVTAQQTRCASSPGTGCAGPSSRCSAR